jgi:hypothetical protein
MAIPRLQKTLKRAPAGNRGNWVSGDQWNELLDYVESVGKLVVAGQGLSLTNGPNGPVIRFAGVPVNGGSNLFQVCICSQSGGSDGTLGPPPTESTYTYNCYTILPNGDQGIQIGSAPLAQMFNKSPLGPVTTASFGIGILMNIPSNIDGADDSFTGGTNTPFPFTLLWTDETVAGDLCAS